LVYFFVFIIENARSKKQNKNSMSKKLAPLNLYQATYRHIAEDKNRQHYKINWFKK